MPDARRYARDKARAAARGTTPYKERVAKGVARGLDKARAAGHKAAARRGPKRGARPLGQGEVSHYSSARGLMGALDRAAARGHHVAISASFDTTAGYRGGTTDSVRRMAGGYRRIVGLPEPEGELNKAGRQRDTGTRPAGPATIVTGPKGQLAAGSIDAGDLADHLRANYVNPWDGIADLLGFGTPE